MAEAQETEKVTPEASKETLQTEVSGSKGRLNFLKSAWNALKGTPDLIKETTGAIKTADKSRGLQDVESLGLFHRSEPPTLVPRTSSPDSSASKK